MERDSRKRAEALLAQMTATEKVGQLNQHLYGFRIYHVEDGKIIFTQELKDEVKKWGAVETCLEGVPPACAGTTRWRGKQQQEKGEMRRCDMQRTILNVYPTQHIQTTSRRA
jgi:hypothetical protein